jgi:hypothetical protein
MRATAVGAQNFVPLLAPEFIPGVENWFNFCCKTDIKLYYENARSSLYGHSVLPGFLDGLLFVGDYDIVGQSKGIQKSQQGPRMGII